jgi:xylan 1,4-beta-xylosidase
MKNRIDCFILYMFLILHGMQLLAQVPETFMNPILPGFHPDPSICRAGDDYYLVNSTFEWFPGIPVYHSRDLVNWELIGYGITRPGQVDLPEGLGNSDGVYAPTIRYHEGLFYIINTCVRCNGNFYITATDPAGPWSDPVWLESPGIDPSLFWNDDGRCYYVGNGNLREGQQWRDQQGAWMQELDLEQGKLVGKRVQLTHGHASNAQWAEGPHLYKIDGTYLLLIAEGGSDFYHAVTIHNSDSLWGPYIPNHANPVITHRHLGSDYPVHSVGHADLVRTQNGEWWSVMLAKRKVDGFTLLARESFMTPVKMEVHEGVLTPVFNPGAGRLEAEQVRPDLPWSPVDPVPERDEFDSETLALHWNFLRTPYEKWYSVSGGSLSMLLRPQVADSLVNPSLIARRIEHYLFKAAVKMDFSPKKKNEQAGMIIYRTSLNHFLFLKEKGELVLVKVMNGKHEEVTRVPYPESVVVLAVEADRLELRFRYGPSPDDLKPMGPVQNLSLVSDELAWGFNGPYIGMYATGNGQASRSRACFDWFDYRGTR